MSHAVRYQLEDLLVLMARLRDREFGCPWDMAQTFMTIAPFTLEEAYEVADAIESGDFPALRAELGDLLFQVVFHARLAEEGEHFVLADVIHGLVEKMLRRHPHVFPDGKINGVRRRHDEHAIEQIKSHWEASKKAEKQAAGECVASALDGVLLGLPALVRAQKLQKKAARVGFDWPDDDGVVDKLREEVAELEDALASGDAAHVADELGDLFFTLVNMARKRGLDAEQLARAATAKFEARFRWLEATLAARQTPVGDVDLLVLEAAWGEAKRALAVAEVNKGTQSLSEHSQ